MPRTGRLQGAIIFHSQLLLADHRIRQHNVLQMLQGGLLLAGLLVAFFGMHIESVEAFIGALAVSLCITAALSILWVAHLPAVKDATAPAAVVRRLWKFGSSAQTGALLQMLANRSNLSILAQGWAALPPQASIPLRITGSKPCGSCVAPLVYTRTAANKPLGSAWSYTQDAWAGPLRAQRRSAPLRC